MKLALSGACAASNEEGAHRRETAGPRKSSSVQTGCSAGRPKNQDLRICLVAPPGDNSRLITNAGHAKLCLKTVAKIIKAEHGPSGYQGPYARDYFIIAATLEETAAAADPRYRRRLRDWVRRNLPGFSVADQLDAMTEIRAYQFAVTARSLGEACHLTRARRIEFKFWLADPIDMTLQEARRIKDRERKNLKRREQGIPQRGGLIAEAKRLEPCTPVKTLYDRQQHGRKPRKPQGLAHRHSELASARGGATPAEKAGHAP